MMFGIMPEVVFMFLLACAISLLTSLANRLLSHPEQMKAWRKEISDWNSELRKARKEKDDKRVDKLLKKQQHILQLNSKMTMQSMKVSLLFFIPLLLIWQLLGAYLYGQPMAILPGAGPNLFVPVFGFTISSLMWWYLMSSMFFSTVFSHVFGLADITE